MDVTKKKDIFKPQETHDNPFDVTLLVEDGTEFKAHRKVLSEASPFFEKLLNSGMIESKVGVARLEMLTEAGLGAVLEFIYTGGVQILAEDDARDLIEMADYLFILPLMTLAGKVLAQTLNTSNCISTYHFAESYQCEDLISDAKTFIHANFTNVAKAEEFLNMSSEEVNKWISSDEIVVSAEEDVFKIILTWIDHNKSEREKYFNDLFRQVRLVYVSRDYLFNDIVTNDLVNDNVCCLTVVKEVMKAIDSNNSENISVPSPRKSLETPVIVVCLVKGGEQLLCYDPRTNTWYKLSHTLPWYKLSHTSPWLEQMVSYHGTVYTLFQRTIQKRHYKNYIFCLDKLFDRWTDVPYEGNRHLQKIFVSNNGDGIYALESERQNPGSTISCPDCASLNPFNRSGRVAQFIPCGKQHLSYITKYKPESKSWEDVLSIDVGLRVEICIVAKDNYIYFIGGVMEGTRKVLADVDRYDLNKRKWDKLANLREARFSAFGTSSREKIFIAGGWREGLCVHVNTCEVYSEITNEWQLIRKPRTILDSRIMCVDGKVYMVDGTWYNLGRRREIECYDPDKDEWNVVTKIPVPANAGLHKGRDVAGVMSCSMRVFLGGKFQYF
ncbi:kelch-like protein 40 [Oculina patagonica]